ncbi:MAG: ABC transporter ATP-binding protein [Burkholderiaceae bacterium]|jgi:simple sugar transport system ATP-binding protein|nr:ABC transporter ATP-binding protein [Burkholderiaceae bacterium]
MTAAPRLALRAITKRYPGVVANDGVSLEVAAGEIHAILGENGAGKSTLVKVIAGAVAPDSGEIEFDGRAMVGADPAAARALGVAMVYQHFSLFDSLTVAENIALGLDRRLDRGELGEAIGAAGERYGLRIDPAAHVHDLSMGERQRVEIVRALLARPRLLILDEPTSVLTPQAAESLFATLRQLAAEGVSVLFISHKLDEIRRLASRCTVMRAGRVVATVDPREQSEHALARLMIGGQPPQIAAHDTEPGQPRLVVERLSLHEGGAPLSFDVRRGEILGIAGVSGNGQNALMALLAGERRSGAASIRLDDAPIGALGPRQRRSLGLRYVPEERVGHGAVPELSLADNALLTIDRLQRRGFVRPADAAAYAGEVVRHFDVRCAGPQARAGSLSGGNLQKYLVGREVLAEPAVLLVNQPTWGVDVGAAAAIRNALIALRARGCAIVVVSEEIDELFELADRLMVMAGGRLSPAVAAHRLAIDELGLWMAGRWPEVPQ